MCPVHFSEQPSLLCFADGTGNMSCLQTKAAETVQENTAQGSCLQRVMCQGIIGNFVGLEFDFHSSHLRRKYQQFCLFLI